MLTRRVRLLTWQASRFKPYPHFYRSTEHNIDMYALATMLGDDDAAKLAHTFVSLTARPNRHCARAARMRRGPAWRADDVALR